MDDAEKGEKSPTTENRSKVMLSGPSSNPSRPRIHDLTSTPYKREATEYDTDHVKKYDEDLNITLIFVGLFSPVSSAFVIDVYSKLQPDPNDQSAVLLRAILLTLNAAPGHDHDLTHLLYVNSTVTANYRLVLLLDAHQGWNPSHSELISNLLLHLVWANRTVLDVNFIRRCVLFMDSVDNPSNRLLAWCIFLGSDVEEEVLKVQDKSDRLEQTLHQLSRAIVSSLNTAHPRSRLIPDVLRYLTKLENRPRCLTYMAYKWCSVICESSQSREDWDLWIRAKLTHTEHHRELVEVVFTCKRSEAIADLLQAWTMRGTVNDNQADALLGICAGHLVGLHSLAPLSPRLRQLVICSIELIGSGGFEEVGVGRFVDLLNHLHVDVKDVDFGWMVILLDTIKSPEGARDLSIQSWGLLVELAIARPRKIVTTYTPQVMASLLEAREWDKLECWMGVVWMTWPPETDATMEDVEHAMVSLFRQRPSAVQKLTQWMEQWSESPGNEVPEAFERICKQPYDIVQLGAPSSPAPDGGAEELPRFSPPAPPPPGGDTFWEMLPLV